MISWIWPENLGHHQKRDMKHAQGHPPNLYALKYQSEVFFDGIKTRDFGKSMTFGCCKRWMNRLNNSKLRWNRFGRSRCILGVEIRLTSSKWWIIVNILITSLSVILYNWFNLVDALQQRSHLFDLNDEHRLTVSFVGWTEVFFFCVDLKKQITLGQGLCGLLVEGM